MGKLLSYQLKRHFKQNWFLVVVPVLLILVNLFTKNFLNHNQAEISAGFIVMGIGIIYAASAITVIVNDYNRFYGKEALFYNSLPVSAGQITSARFFNYLILFIVHSFIFMVNMTAFVIINAYLDRANFGEEFQLVFREIVKILSTIEPSHIAISIIVSFILIAFIIAKIMLSISISGEKKVNKLDFGGAVLSYILLTVLTYVIIFPLLDKFAVYGMDIEILNGNFVFNFPFIIINVILTVVFLAFTFFEHKKRVSVN